MRSVIALVILYLSLFSARAAVAPIVPLGQEAQHAATHHIRMENAVDAAGCSATSVGPHTILTAGHCFIPSHTIEIDNNVVEITNVDFDDNDHLLLTVSETFKYFLPIVQRDLLPNEIVHMWGNPGRSRDVYRIGIFEKTDEEMNWFLMPGAPGDSGSGILDANGNIIAVLSVGNQSGEVGGIALAFNTAQLARAVR